MKFLFWKKRKASTSTVTVPDGSPSGSSYTTPASVPSASPEGSHNHKAKSAVGKYLACLPHIEKMEQSGEIIINALRGGITMTLPIYQYFFTEGYLKHGDDRRALAFLDKVRAVINLRRGVVDANTGNLPCLDVDKPLYITVACLVDPSKPIFVGVQYADKLVIESYEPQS